MVIRVPGKTIAGSGSEGLVELVDLFPTLAELCGVDVPSHVQGRSLVPMLTDPDADGKNVVYTVVARGSKLGKALRTNRWRYAKWVDGEELYDLNNDVEEHHNLAKSAEHASVLGIMRAHLSHIEKMAGEKAKTSL